MDTGTFLLVAVAILFLVGGGYFFLRWRQFHQKGEESYYHFRCPGCSRRLRYQAQQVGRKGQCSNCGREIIFPALKQSID